jgi:uncharacterized protein YjbI with pentapeptide repeats
MTNFIKSKVQQSLSFLLMLVIAFSAFSGVLFVNPSPSYAYYQSDLDRALSHSPMLMRADLSGANLMGARLSGARFMAADLSGADLSEADLSVANVSVSGAIADSKTKFPDGFDARRAEVEFRD